MIIHPDFDPVALHLGSLSIHWYGIMYLLSFAGVYLLANYRARNHSVIKQQKWHKELIGDLIFYGAMGAVVGGRIGYILFYKAADYFANPLQMLKVWEGGMSFHGGLLGVIVAIMLFAKKNDRSFWQIVDFMAPLGPIGLFFGRIGNFINQELWGKTTDLPWGMVFSNGGALPRHPSMLYEALLEGVVLFIVLWWYSRLPRAKGQISGLFLVGYALSRIAVEFVRVPDAHLNYLLFDWLTMGHVLSLPMLVFGLFLLYRHQK